MLKEKALSQEQIVKVAEKSGETVRCARCNKDLSKAKYGGFKFGELYLGKECVKAAKATKGIEKMTPDEAKAHLNTEWREFLRAKILEGMAKSASESKPETKALTKS